jgi:hypothetical protein
MKSTSYMANYSCSALRAGLVEHQTGGRGRTAQTAEQLSLSSLPQITWYVTLSAPFTESTFIELATNPFRQLRDLVHMFVSRVELLPEDETTAEHEEAKRVEAQLIETDRAQREDGEPGLFKGAFSRNRLHIHGPIHDVEDGVMRCPNCAWEMEDGECGHCGYAEHESDFSDEENDGDATTDTQSVISVRSSEYASDEGDEDGESHFNAEEYVMNMLPPGPTRTIVANAMRGRPHHFTARRGGGNWPRSRNRTVNRPAHPFQPVRRDRASTVDTDATDTTMMGQYPDHRTEYGTDVEDDEEMAAFLERHPYYSGNWNSGGEGTVDDDEEMTSVGDGHDNASTTSFHREAMRARDNGMNPPFESDVETNGSEINYDDGSTTGDGHTSVGGSDDDGQTPEPTPAPRRLATRPARIMIDSDDDEEEESDDSSSGEDEDGEEDDSEGEDEDDSDDDDGESTPSPPRPAAARQARVQMHQDRRGGSNRDRGRGNWRGNGSGRGRGRPRTRY